MLDHKSLSECGIFLNSSRGFIYKQVDVGRTHRYVWTGLKGREAHFQRVASELVLEGVATSEELLVHHSSVVSS